MFLHSLHAIAAKNGVVLPQITYQLAAEEKGSPLQRYVVDMTFTSPYLQVRGYIHDLRTVPGFRCERLTLSRPNIAETQLEVHMQCSILVEATK